MMSVSCNSWRRYRSLVHMHIMNTQPNKKPEKKSETIEVRVSYTEKLAFMEACKQAGTTASHAIRGYISDVLSPATGHSISKRNMAIIGLFTCLIGASVAMISLSQKDTVLTTGDRVVRYFDQNTNGFIDTADIKVSDPTSAQTINWLIATADTNDDNRIDGNEIQALANITVKLRGKHSQESGGMPHSRTGESVVIIPPSLSADERKTYLKNANFQKHLSVDDHVRILKLIDILTANNTASDINSLKKQN